ncbi:MAG: alpha/beta fold hydrolase [Candidatus Competibacteraceae bacterium]
MKLDMISRYPTATPKSTPLLFVHGSFSEAHIWDENFLPYFARHGYEAHAFSLRGHGLSEGHERLHTWRLADYVADLVRAAATMPSPPLLIGHSMGGMIIQKYLESHPAVAGVVLMASAPPQGLLPTTLHMALRHPFLFPQIWLFSLLGPNYGTPDLMRRALFSPNMPFSKLREFFRYVQAESQMVSLDMLGLNPLRLKPEALQMPFLVLGAQNDVFIAPALVEQTARFYHAEVKIFPNMAHAMMLESNWQDAADYLLGWLERALSAQPVAMAA